MNTDLKNPENEKIVPLNEDLNKHVQDDASFQKAMQSQKNDLERIRKEKESGK